MGSHWKGPHPWGGESLRPPRRRRAPSSSSILLEAVEARLMFFGGEIRGVKFHDLDGDGFRDGDEPGLAGWTIYLDASHNGKLDPQETSTTTGADGSYSFVELAAGNYLVAEVNKPGWRQTGPNVTATPGPAPGAALPRVASHYSPGKHRLVARGGPNDPLFPQQWHLENRGQSGGTAGEDANVVPAWKQGMRGNGVTIAVVDDGVEYTHPDLVPNYSPAHSYDFNDNDPDAGPGSEWDVHGTAVAGVAGARGGNGLGVSGSAPEAWLASIRVLGGEIDDATEAAALSYHNQDIAIYNNSWGPFDDGETLLGPGPLTLAAIEQSINSGRGGLGNIYLWAAGNGLEFTDNVNYDGYANSRYVIAVTAIDHNGIQAPYAEPGAPILISAHSGDGYFGPIEDSPVAPAGGPASSGITTTDRQGSEGYDFGDYTRDFGGTSSSTPLVAGAIALMLQANAALTWRDVQHILVHTARRNDPQDFDWVRNGAGLFVNHLYGFGALDAAAAVRLASSWQRVGAEVAVTSGDVAVNQPVPDADLNGVSSSVTINDLIKVEKVEVVLDMMHPYRGDIKVALISPDGTESVLAEPHDDGAADYSRWTFTSTHHWDEIAKGTWTLKVTDERGEDLGTWNSWRLNVYGTAVNGVHYIHVDDAQVVTDVDFGNQSVLPPKVVEARFDHRSAPHRIVFDFDRDIGVSPTANEFELKNLTTGQSIPGSQIHVEYHPASRRVIWTFPGLPGGLLPDGNYVARLSRPGTQHELRFFQLRGDADHDRDVDHADFLVLLENFGKAGGFEDGDFDYNGRVDFADFQLLEQAFGRRLNEPSAGDGFEVQTTVRPIAPPKGGFGVRPIAPPARRPV